MSFADIARQFSRNRTLIFNGLGFASNVFVTTALLSWLPTYFHRMEGLPMSQASIKGGAVMMMAILGAPLGGWLADKWMARRATARLLFPALSSLCTAILLFVSFAFLEGNLQYGLLLFTGVAAVAFVPASVAITQDVIHPGLRATSLSLNVIVQHLLGSALGPLFVGYLSDRYGLETALTCLPPFCLLAALLFFVASFFYHSDLDKVEEIEILQDH